MPTFRIEGFVETFEAVADALQLARDAAVPGYDAVLQEWTRRTIDDAKAFLGRPDWLLSKAIDSKMKHYSDDRKLWAMTGTKLLANDGNLRTPADYRRHTSGTGGRMKKHGARKGRVGPRYEFGFARTYDRKITSNPGFYGRFHENGYTQAIDEQKSERRARVDESGQTVWERYGARARLEFRRRKFGRASERRYVCTPARRFFWAAKRNNADWVYLEIYKINDELLEKIRVYILQWNQRRYDEAYDFGRR